METLDLADHVPRVGSVPCRPCGHRQLGISLLLSRQVGCDDEPRSGAHGFGQSARACPRHHDVRAAQPIGHVVNEALNDQPSRPSPRLKPAQPALDAPVAPTDGHHLEVFQATTRQRPDLPAQAARTFGAPCNYDDERLLAEAQRPSQFSSLPPENRPRTQLAAYGQPGLDNPIGGDAVE